MRILILFSVTLIGCGKPMPDFKSLCASTTEAPYIHSEEQEPWLATLQYRPSWFIAAGDLLEAHEKGQASVDKIGSLIGEYAGSATFVLKVGPHPNVPAEKHVMTDIVNAHPNQAAFSANMHHLIYGLDDKIYLLADGEKLPVSQYQMDRNWGITHTNRFMLTFGDSLNGKMLADADTIEVVIQNLHPGLPELRFLYPSNPLAAGNYTAQHIAESLQAPPAE